ncbi:Vacuolar protein sorting-associated protein 11 [Amphibalanus amphitrite]|uniref:Vacuolar protein sorting-associated protein 11 homolog n=1 Tax=Amphibalanus amphitrite TaxID=1232801 RepID=A0A6A4V456_AMPAM|nr:Vacuolar protein sorting-associated protein 11 [Amphibalanus amphitrite]
MALLQSADVLCTGSGRGCLVLGDSRGLVHFVSRQLEVLSHRLFEARVSQLAQLKFSPVLAAAGEDEIGVSSIKVFGLEQLDGGGAPRLLRQLKLPPAAADGGTAVTCLAVHENLFMAAGFADGRVILWRGDLTRERAGKPQVLHSGSAPVTGLGFRSTGKTSHLFVATAQEVCCYNVTFKDKENQIRLDETGCAPHCAVISEGTSEPQFTVGKPDAIYCYSPNERGACFVFEGEKRLLHWFKGYLVVLGAEKVTAAAGGAETTSTERHVLTVYDVANKYVALHVPLRDVQHVVSDWGQLFVVTSQRKLHALRELDTQAKLQVLFKKNLYDMAIKLAQSQQYDADGLMNIFKEYGDYLHGKGDYSGAVQQYIKTIGKLIPSYVIRKYLDTQRISDLTVYLEALHHGGHGSADHTTLLINCYTKLRLTEQLDQFIQGEGDAVEYDVATAVRVCRSSGYHEQALLIADRHRQVDVVVSILTEDLGDPGRALQYISKLPHEQCEAAILRHGAALLKVKPTDTVELLKKLSCAPKSGADADSDCSVPIQQYLDLFVAAPSAQASFLQHLMEVRPAALDSDALLALLEVYLPRSEEQQDPGDDWTPPGGFGGDGGASGGDGGATGGTDTSVPGGDTEKALRVLDCVRLKDVPLALRVCQDHGFQQGVAKLYERYGMHSHILHTQLEAADYPAALETCRRFGGEQPLLWLDALRALTKLLNPPSEVITVVLDNIEKGKVAPSLEVVEILVESPTLELGAVRDYMMRVLTADQEAIDEHTAAAQKFAEEAESIRKEIETEENSAMVFQRTICSACSQPLELPSVHFFCPHSFHQHCFQSYAEGDDSCPLCLTEQTELRRQTSSQPTESTEGADMEELYSELRAADDKFSVLSDFFGRGVFSEVERPAEGSQQAAAAPPPPQAQTPQSEC